MTGFRVRSSSRAKLISAGRYAFQPVNALLLFYTLQFGSEDYGEREREREKRERERERERKREEESAEEEISVMSEHQYFN